MREQVEARTGYLEGRHHRLLLAMTCRCQKAARSCSTCRCVTSIRSVFIDEEWLLTPPVPCALFACIAPEFCETQAVSGVTKRKRSAWRSAAASSTCRWKQTWLAVTTTPRGAQVRHECSAAGDHSARSRRLWRFPMTLTAPSVLSTNQFFICAHELMYGTSFLRRARLLDAAATASSSLRLHRRRRRFPHRVRVWPITICG